MAVVKFVLDRGARGFGALMLVLAFGAVALNLFGYIPRRLRRNVVG